MVRKLLVLAAACLVGAAAAPSADAQKKTRKKIEITRKYSGSVENAKLAKPDAIVSEKSLAAVWKAWGAEGAVPNVDFEKFIVVGVYSVGSRLNLAGANLDEKGNLTVLGFGTRDIRPGFRYVLGVVPREGIKTVNGQKLPKD